MGEYESVHRAGRPGRQPGILTALLLISVVVTQARLAPEYTETTVMALAALLVFAQLRQAYRPGRSS